MTDRNELINDIAELKAKRDRLLAQVKEAEQWESVAWDSYACSRRPCESS